MDESAYAHLGNAAMILMNLLHDLPENSVSVTVSTAEISAVLARISKARVVLARHAAITGSNPL